MRPPVRPPQLRRSIFPLTYPPHLLVLPATFGLHLLLQTYPYFPAFYAVPVRRTKGLLTASFRFHLAVDTLAVQLCVSSLPRHTRDFHPLDYCPCWANKNSKAAFSAALEFTNNAASAQFCLPITSIISLSITSSVLSLPLDHPCYESQRLS